MKKNFILAVSMISTGILAGCGQTEKLNEEKVAAEVKEKTEIADPKAWKDVTPENVKDLTSVKEFISNYNYAFKKVWRIIGRTIIS